MWNLKTQAPEKEEIEVCKPYPTENTPCFAKLFSPLFSTDSICQGSRTRSAKPRGASSEGEEGVFLREEQILPRPLLFLVCERDVDDAHELGLDDVPIAGLVVLHQHLVRSLGPHGHDQPPARLQLLQQLQHGEILVSRGKQTPHRQRE